MRNENSQTSAGNDRFKQIAAKVRRRRVIVAAILIGVTAICTICLWNYKQAGWQVKPPIVLTAENESYAGGQYFVYYSLGFKQVHYLSDYGRNYYQRLPLWEDIDTDSKALTRDQYEQLMGQIEQTLLRPEKLKHIKLFPTFHGTILDVKRNKEQLTIYLYGASASYFEYDDQVYKYQLYDDEDRVIFSEPYRDVSPVPIIAKATIKDGQLTLNHVQQYADENTGNLYDRFPQPIARLLLASEGITESLNKQIVHENELAAIAHFGKPLAQKKSVHLDLKKKIAETYILTNTESGEVETLIGKKPLK